MLLFCGGMRGLKTQPLLGSARLGSLTYICSSAAAVWPLIVQRHEFDRHPPKSSNYCRKYINCYRITFWHLPSKLKLLSLSVSYLTTTTAVVKVHNTHHRIDKGNKLRRWNLFNRPFLSSGAKKAVRNEFSIIK